MNELKPCPFCGGSAEVREVDNTGPYDRQIVMTFSPGCGDEDCIGEWGWAKFPTRKLAIEKWNTRYTDEQAIREDERKRCAEKIESLSIWTESAHVKRMAITAIMAGGE